MTIQELIDELLKLSDEDKKEDVTLYGCRACGSTHELKEVRGSVLIPGIEVG